MGEAIESVLEDGGLLVLKINRPERRNAISHEVMERLDEALIRAAGDPLVKVLMITGAGNQTFCSGGDLKEFQHLYSKEEALSMLSKMGGILYRLLTLEKPTIAYLNGTAVGGGCELAAACDLRAAVPYAKAGFVQANLGITTGWGGGSILYEKLSVSSAHTFLLSGSLFSAAEAKGLGFIDFIDDESGKWDAFLTRLLKKELGVLTAYKRIVAGKWEASGLKGRMDQEILQCAKLWAEPAHHEAVKRFLKQK
ncbi:enoyl-CoA hydratase/isomerase family protein [Peribacillus kribbensis]|uniref:enoyl-CoA hydratase/isomerase family protein n=1 Tax=Peribacillus kribbensis TaxID=356658 RepID=UPI0003FD5F9A|nr:enoyl-CoA hydratase/isomerase family protein [Peribacillus kribbensis]